MSLIEAILLGAMQGITEFLPVSSSGHLAVLHYFFGNSPDNLVFDIAVHIGTALSVVVVYRSILKQIIIDLYRYLRFKEQNVGSKLALYVVIGSLPAAVVGIFFKDYFVAAFSNLNVVIAGFIFTGIILFMTRSRKVDSSDFLSLGIKTDVNPKRAIIIGLSQAFAILPGVSRSGSTIAAGLFTGLSNKEAALFSFLLALPAIFGAGLLQIKDLQHFNTHQLFILVCGLLTSFTVGFFALKLLLKFVQKGRIYFFSYYLWSLAFALIVFRLLE